MLSTELDAPPWSIAASQDLEDQRCLSGELTIDCFANPFEASPAEQHLRSPVCKADDNLCVWKVTKDGVLHGELFKSAGHSSGALHLV
jgi:hypothetical protein